MKRSTGRNGARRPPAPNQVVHSPSPTTRRRTRHTAPAAQRAYTSIHEHPLPLTTIHSLSTSRPLVHFLQLRAALQPYSPSARLSFAPLRRCQSAPRAFPSTGPTRPPFTSTLPTPLSTAHPLHSTLLDCFTQFFCAARLLLLSRSACHNTPYIPTRRRRRPREPPFRSRNAPSIVCCPLRIMLSACTWA